MNDFYGDWTGKEPKFAGSDLSRYLLPSAPETLGKPHQMGESLLVKLDQQTRILEANRSGYILTAERSDQNVSVSRISDATYSLSLSALPKSVEIALKRESQLGLFPCLHPNANRLPPFISVEVKVDGGIQKQTHQQVGGATCRLARLR